MVFNPSSGIRHAWRCALGAAFVWAETAFGQLPSPARAIFSGSFKEVAGSAALAAHAPRHARLLRAQLRADEAAAPVTFEVALRMRNFSELQDRLARGEHLGAAEMAARYYPLADDYARVAAWVRRQGLEVTRTDDNHLAVFGRGSVAVAAQAFQVSFARITAEDGDYTSAVSPPSLPADLAAAVLGVHGLQPHLRLRRRLAPGPLQSDANGGNSQGYTPSQIAKAYGASASTFNGAGQTIAIFSGAFVKNSDLTTFWAATGVTNSLSHIQSVPVGSGPAANDSSSGTEAALDVEWASSLAPGAIIRVYGANSTDPNFFDEILQQIYTDIRAGTTNVQQVSMSYGGYEAETDADYIIILSQYFANLASAGVTVFNASGDQGSNENGLLQVSTPTSDPNVTGVGGTSLSLDANGNVNSETGWSGSGGGVSQVFSRPSWQVGAGVPAGTMRLVPDVAAFANPTPGGVLVYNGVTQTVGGTSMAAPIWAAFCAMLNQARAAAGLTSLGNFNSQLYPLLGTTAFRDITGGTNGSYSAGAGYDLVTGLGTPNMSVLLQYRVVVGSAPSLYSQLGSRTVTAGQPATFYVVGTGAATISYQWQRAAAGSTSWLNLGNSGTYAGVGTQMLVVNAATAAMTGDQFRCVATNSFGTATSAPADLLTVNQLGVTTLAGWPGVWGAADGTGWSARFEYPGSLREDAAGNIYVADARANLIRKVTPAGVVTTVSGTAGLAGATNGPAAAALFNTPAGVAVDGAGNIFVADNANYLVREISAAGVVSTVAGKAGTPGSVDGIGAAARFADPEDIAVDLSGNLYVADGTGNRVRKIAPGGTVTTLAGSGGAGLVNGTGLGAQFSDPVGLAVDGAGTVYVADMNNEVIRKITSAGVVTTWAGSGLVGSADGTASAARFDHPGGVGLDTLGNLYVADTNNSTIRMVTATGTVTTVAGAAGVERSVDGPSASARFCVPTQVIADPSGVLYVADAYDATTFIGSSTIRRIVPGVLTPPQILIQPAPAAVVAGQLATFTVGAAGTPPLSYQWEQLLNGATAWTALTDGGAISGSATPNLTIAGAGLGLYGSQYECLVQNSVGSVISAPALLVVLGPPMITSVPLTQSFVVGSTANFSVTAIGSSLSYQWSFNGVPIGGATAATFAVSNFSPANAGTYAVSVSNPYGSVTVTVATTTVHLARLINLSASSNSSPGTALLTVGFVVGGSAPKLVLLRGVGPTLAQFGVAGVLPDPTLTLFDVNSAVLAANTTWGGSTSLAAAFASVGAFALPLASADSALLLTESPGNYSIQVAGVSGDSGNALAEIYDLEGSSAPARLLDISSRSAVNGTTGILTAGFVIGGAGVEKVLIRGVGPTLAQYGVTSPLSNPVITLFDANSHVVATNSGWGGTAALSAIFQQVGAFPLAPTSSDAALVISLPVGRYTVQLTGAGGAPGIGLVEVYEVVP